MAQLRARPGPERLPAIGERLHALDAHGRPLQIVRRHNGDVELHTATASVELDHATATMVGAFVAGHYLVTTALAARLDDLVGGGLVFDWVRLERGDHAVGRTIADLAVRRRTGVTIVAVLRGSVPIVVPEPDVRLEAGDDLVVVARDADLGTFVDLVAGGG